MKSSERVQLVEKLLEQLRHTKDPKLRRLIYREIYQLLHECIKISA